MLRASLIIVFLGLFMGGCVTVNMANDGTAKKAEGVTFKAPAAPFVEDERNLVDAAWKNPKNGNVISFVSDCSDPSDPPLNQIVGGVLAGLSHLKVEKEETVTVQGREGERVHASGKVDGVGSEIDLLVFKRNHCIYILTYLGVTNAFAENREAFSRFITEFRTP